MVSGLQVFNPFLVAFFVYGARQWSSCILFTWLPSFSNHLLLRRLFFPQACLLIGENTQEPNKCMIIVIAFEKSRARKEGWEMLGCCSFKWDGQLRINEEVTFGQIPEEGFGGFYSYEKEFEYMNLSSLVCFNSV